MVLIIQILGALFGLFLMYLAFMNYKRKELTINEWAFWTVLALGFSVISLAPEILNPLIRTLNISRKMDLLIIAGFMLLTGAVFHSNIITVKTQRKVEELVRKLAIEEARKREK